MSDGLSNLKAAALALAGVVLVGGAILADAVADRTASAPTETETLADGRSKRTTRVPRAAPAAIPDSANASVEVPVDEEELIDDSTGSEPAGIDPSGYDPSPLDEQGAGPEPIAAGASAEEIS